MQRKWLTTISVVAIKQPSWSALRAGGEFFCSSNPVAMLNVASTAAESKTFLLRNIWREILFQLVCLSSEHENSILTNWLRCIFYAMNIRVVVCFSGILLCVYRTVYSLTHDPICLVGNGIVKSCPIRYSARTLCPFNSSDFISWPFRANWAETL